MKNNILIVPGWQNSDHEHWQSIWEKKLNATRVTQDNWMNPSRSAWTSRLKQAISAQPTPPVLITHSLGCNTTAIVSKESNCEVAGAFIVCPADLEQSDTPSEVKGFLPMALTKLRFPSVVIASENDPYCSLERAQYFAKQWGSQLVSMGAKGHINVEAGFGEWPEGEVIFQEFLKSLS